MGDLQGSCAADLHVRSWGSGPTPAWCEAWVPVFTRWALFQRRYFEQNAGDLTWWYRERPQVSLLGAAIWATGGVALEEYRNEKWHDKEQYPGRADLWATVGDMSHSVEAKHIWSSLNGGPHEGAMVRAFEEALHDTKKVDEAPNRRAALLFVTPYLPVRDGVEEAEVELRAQLKAHRRATYPEVRKVVSGRGLRVDYYPQWARGSVSLLDGDNGTKGLYPGITLFLGFSRP